MGAGGGSNHQGATNGRAGNTNEAREHGELRGGRQTKRTAHSVKAQGTRGPNQRKLETKGA